MTEKERILELVKNEIISMEEGIQLLEKLSDKKEEAATNVVPFQSSSTVEEEKEATVNETAEEETLQEEATEESKGNDFDKVFQDVGEALKNAFEQAKPHAQNIGKTLKNTFSTVKDSVKDNVDWKEVTVNVPTLASTPIQKEYEFEDAISILEIQNVNGKVEILKSESSLIKVIASGKTYANGNQTGEEVFEEKTTISIVDEKLVVDIPIHRMKVDITLYLPEKFYDYMSVKSMNGDITLSDFEVGDVFLNSMNGKIKSNLKQAAMLEVKGMNGQITVEEGKYKDVLVNTVNSEVIIKADTSALKVGLVNGVVKATIQNTDITNVDLSNVNGNVKISLPKGIGLDGAAQTTFGGIHQKLEAIDIQTLTNKNFVFTRIGDPVANVSLRTTTGSIFIKED